MAEPGDVIIQIKNVSKAFDDNVVFTDLNLDVKKGETITIMGGSGTGKSVTLKFLVGLLEPDEGDVLVFGDNIRDFDEEKWLHTRRRISMLFQSGALFDSLDVRDNIAYPLRVHQPKISESDVDRIVEEKLELVGLPGIMHLKPSELSGGMRKRVGLARAIAIEPDVILWDEPTTGLDPINTNRINILIRRMQEVLKCTSIVVTHDMGSAFKVSDRIAFLYDKRIILTDTVENVRNSKLVEVRNFIEGRYDEMKPADEHLGQSDGE